MIRIIIREAESKKKRWLSRRQGLEKEAGLRRILSSQQIHIYYKNGSYIL
jgi:hypothetical protein